MEYFNKNEILINVTEIAVEEEIEKYLYLTLINVYNSVKFWRDLYILFGSLITILGFILNILCIIIFFKSKLFRNSSFPYYVYVIAIVDSLNICFRFLLPQSIEFYIRHKLEVKFNITSNLINQNEYDIYTSQITSDYLCSAMSYFQNSLTLVSVWLMVAVSVERWLVIKFALQTKYMIKLRAFIILFFLFFIVFSFNLFDLSPGLYIKPQWYSNLTLFCERHDIFITETNSTDIYKTFGSLKFNTRTFALVRTIFQSILPFLVVLLFNSLIIYNFKKIKLAARGAGRGKSNSCASGMSDGLNIMFSNSSNNRSQKKFSRYLNHIKISSENFVHLKTPSSIIFKNSNMSLSPLPIKSSKPTSLVSALNLAERTPNENVMTKNIIKNRIELINKNQSNKFLMPPSFSSLKQQKLDSHSINDSTSRSIGTTNSSANLSSVTASNLTTATFLNQKNPKNLNINDIYEKNRSNSITSCLESEKFSVLITDLSPKKKKFSTVSSITNASSFKHSNKLSLKNRRSSTSRFKLNRETDIMLIVLSFCILLSQLPFTMIWYLIYYHDVLQYIDSVYFNASVPKVFYLIRILEMIYFSSNFLFYITLSPSLRKEIQNYVFETNFKYFFDKFVYRENNFENCENKKNQNLPNSKKDTIRTLSFGNDDFLVNKNKNRLQLKDSNSRILFSNSSSDFYVDYLERLRSISPTRPQKQQQQSFSEDLNQNQIEKSVKENLNQNKIRLYFTKKNNFIKTLISKQKCCNHQNTYNSSIKNKKNDNTNVKQLSNIKIVIEKLYDENNEDNNEN